MIEYNHRNSFCKECGLYKRVASPCIKGRGNINSDILILGECPGEHEDAQGSPFVGPSGNFLNHFLNALDIDCYISNAVKCRPTYENGKNRNPTPKESEFCKPFTIDLLLTMKPKIIITLGRVAFSQLLKLNMALEVSRGKEFYFPDFDATVVPTYHPSFLLRVDNNNKDKMNLLRKQFGYDLKKAKDLSSIPKMRKTKSLPKVIADPLEIEEYLVQLRDSESFAFDLETTGLSFREDKITDVSFCHEFGKGVHIKWNKLLKHENLLKEVLLSDNLKIAHNLSFDYKFLKQAGFDFKGKFFDTMLAYHTISMSVEGGAARDLYSLDTMSFLFSTEGGYKSILEAHGGIAGFQKEVDEDIKNQGTLFNMDDYQAVDPTLHQETEDHLQYCNDYIRNSKEKIIKDLGIDELTYYAAMDADVTYRIYKSLEPTIRNTYEYPFYEIIMPLCIALANATINGVRLDSKYMDETAEKNKNELVEIEAKFAKKFGSEYSITSSKDLGDLLFGKLGISPNPQFMTSGGKSGIKKPSTNVDAIKFYSSKKPSLKIILDHRGLAKENSTYLVGFKKQMDPYTERIYPDFFQLTATGRSSSFFHTVPRANKIRNIVVPQVGWKLVVADLSQVELRMLAQLANDVNMINAFNSGHDFHTYTACVMFGIDIEKFDKGNPDHSERRSASKCVSKKSIVIIDGKILNIGSIINNTKEDSFVESRGSEIWDGVENIPIKSTYRGKIQDRLLIVTKRNVLCCSKVHKIKKSDGTLVSASDLVKGDVLQLSSNLPQLKEEKQYIKYNPFDEDNHDRGFKVEMCRDWSYVAGLFVGDGCFNAKSISISTGGGNDFTDWQKIVSSCFNKVGLKTAIRDYKKISDYSSKSACVYLGSTKLRRFFDCVGLTSKKEGKLFRIPEWVLNNTDNCWEFLGGLIDTDGTIDKVGRVSITTKSWELTQDLVILSLRLGLLYSIEVMYNKKYNRDYYRIHFLKRTLYKIKDRNILKHPDKKERIKNISDNFNGKKDTNYKENEIIKITNLEPEELVDLEVNSNDHLYWINGLITHNSINFGIVYGLHYKSLARDLNISDQEALSFMNRFFTSYPRVAPWIEEVKNFASINKYVETLYGRRRHLPNVESDDKFIREAALRQSVNTIIQSCISHHTLIPTSTGYKKIGVLNTEAIYSFNVLGVYRKGKVFNSNRKDMYRYYFSDGTSIICTPDHRFKILKEGMVEDFKEIGTITKDDYIIGCSIKNNADYQYIHTSKLYSGSYSRFSYCISLKIDEDLGWVMGLIVGNGNFSNRGFKCCFNTYDTDVANKMLSIINDKFNCNYKIGYGKKEKYDDVLIVQGYHNKIDTFFQKCGLKKVTAKYKVIPDIIWGSPDSVICRFISGLYTTDGTPTKSGATYTTTSETLAFDLGNLLQIVGVRSTISFRNDGAYNVNISSDFPVFMKKIGFSSIRKINASKNLYKVKTRKDFSDIPYWMSLNIVNNCKLQKEDRGSLTTIKSQVRNNKKSLSVQTALCFRSDCDEYRFIASNKYLKNIKKKEYYGNEVCYDISILDGEPEFLANGTLIHNSANDISSMAIIKMQRWLTETKKRTLLVGTVHDSILKESPPEELEESTQMLVNFMTKDVPRVSVELKADVAILDKWEKD